MGKHDSKDAVAERREKRRRLQAANAALYAQAAGLKEEDGSAERDDGEQAVVQDAQARVGVNGNGKAGDGLQGVETPRLAADHNVVAQLRVKPDVPKAFKVYVLLEQANLEVVKVGREGGYQLLNADDHQNLARKSGRDLADCRPDITHQCLLALFDSPLNKAGRLKVFVRTRKNVLIDIHPDTRLPRTMKRFSGLIVELLQKLKVRATNAADPLLKVIRNPVTSHLPVGCRKVLMTYNTDNVIDTLSHAHRVSSEASAEGSTVSSVLYVVGAIAHGKVDLEWGTDEEISIGNFPLSAANVCSKVTQAFEHTLGIL
ncbi:Ribosomal RNA small subunit methyltransferase NEP1 [Porphyridium purpureum]|uniref:Ribosomal RNA small subunit methyltransferase NEP1 n=1 Tax=Porphyridium purpureum TaxID=35688 RepID=A0A5J4YGY8_PORPP|nr:Ribosomal RNA small subunit methyltransferase NEP1 [Porphyridium purpureum]|eukprot:POR1680..scf270_19